MRKRLRRYRISTRNWYRKWIANVKSSKGTKDKIIWTTYQLIVRTIISEYQELKITITEEIRHNIRVAIMTMIKNSTDSYIPK